eukprot:5049583-Prymnesium_polylepis.1
MSPAARGARLRRWSVRRERRSSADASVALEHGSAPREVTSQNDAFVYHVYELLTQRAVSLR